MQQYAREVCSNGTGLGLDQGCIVPLAGIAPETDFLSIPKHKVGRGIEDSPSMYVCLAREIQAWFICGAPSLP
jgi:hypothetical protein